MSERSSSSSEWKVTFNLGGHLDPDNLSPIIKYSFLRSVLKWLGYSWPKVKNLKRLTSFFFKSSKMLKKRSAYLSKWKEVFSNTPCLVTRKWILYHVIRRWNNVGHRMMMQYSRLSDFLSRLRTFQTLHETRADENQCMIDRWDVVMFPVLIEQTQNKITTSLSNKIWIRLLRESVKMEGWIYLTTSTSSYWRLFSILRCIILKVHPTHWRCTRSRLWITPCQSCSLLAVARVTGLGTGIKTGHCCK